MRRSIGAFILTLTAVLAAPGAVSAAPTAGGVSGYSSRPIWPLVPQGRWITDAAGRVIVLHGVNVVARTSPWDPRAAGFGDDDARLLARAGFGAVRLAVIPAAVMPRPGAIDRAYLDRVAATVRLLARHRLLTLLVLDQEQWGPRYLGAGLPGWMTLDDGIRSGPRRRAPGGYVTNPALARAFDGLWANRLASGEVGLADRWTQIAGALARRMARSRSLVGYDLMNAPWPGSIWRGCANNGCAGFQTGRLARLWRRTVAMVRSVDSDAITWIEPPALAPATGRLLLPATGDRRRSGLSFQIDCALAAAAVAIRPCGSLQAAALDRAADWSRAAARPALLTGAAAVPPGSTLAGLRGISDRRMVSWLRWTYANVPRRPLDQPGIIDDQGLPATGENVDESRLGALDGPHPRVVSGTPLGWRLDPVTNVFTASWKTRLPAGGQVAAGSISDVWIGRRTYAYGYRLVVTGARVVARSADRVVLRARGGAGSVTLTATPLPAPAG